VSSTVVSWQRIYNSLTVTSNHTLKSSFHSLISFLPIFCNCQLNSVPLLPSSYPDKLASRNLTPFYSVTASFGALLYKNFARITHRTQPLYCWEDVFTGPFNSNGSYSTVAWVFVAAGIRLPSRCLAMNVYSDFTIPAFGRYVTIKISACIRAALTEVFREFSILPSKFRNSSLN
jgi:hypothetical protein